MGAVRFTSFHMFFTDQPSVRCDTSVNPEHFIGQKHAERENIATFSNYIEIISPYKIYRDYLAILFSDTDFKE